MSTYQLEQIRPTQLSQLAQIEVKGQEKLKEKFGEKLNLVQVYGLIKQKTKNFTAKDAVAIQLDAAFADLLKKRGFWEAASAQTSTPAKPKKPTKAILQKKIKGYEVALRLAKDETSKSKLEKKIKGYKIAMRLAA